MKINEIKTLAAKKLAQQKEMTAALYRAKAELQRLTEDSGGKPDSEINWNALAAKIEECDSIEAQLDEFTESFQAWRAEIRATHGAV